MTTLRELKESIDLVAELRPDLLDTKVWSDDDPYIYIGTCQVITVNRTIPGVALVDEEIVIV